MKPPYQPITDPLDFEIEPGRRVRDLSTPEECASATLRLEMDMESILAQIGRAEADPDRVEPGWRTRAQTALRWKKRIRKAVLSYRQVLVSQPGRDARRRAILDTIREEVGDEAFDAYVDLARGRRPSAFAEENAS